MPYSELALDLSGSGIWFFTGGFVWIGFGILLSFGEVRRGRRRRETTGKCVSSSYRPSDRSYSYLFRDPTDSTVEAHIRVKSGGGRGHFKEGQSVTLSYDPKDHRDTKLAEERSRLDPWKGVLYVSPFGLIPLAQAWIGLSILQ
ncbi:hypothetical protein STTU_3394 [Streptomyces sp. Tu6071]|uniref:DUF3592 domain-containing protein n=1 Tax=Streptomyces sp. Tu6071 TaxID=355249 RepID=UPI00020E591F|nr:DUF3592 domain-containing protein [Streptomyces sp. Tu6071]EGJ76183.1 hypothetical protein STTU_3394 [Streptomyces sp. Tu6071]